MFRILNNFRKFSTNPIDEILILNERKAIMRSKLRNIAVAEQFNRKSIDFVINESNDIKRNLKDYNNKLKGKYLANIYYEPSTRIASNFENAMLRLGGEVLNFTIPPPSLIKNELLIDTLKVLEQYTDISVLRHPKLEVYKNILPHLKNPLINAGDRIDKYPTQSLIDIMTIKNELNLNIIEKINITLVGNLKYERNIHSLVQMLSNYNRITFNFVSPVELQMPKEIKKLVNYKEYTSYKNVINETDVLYMTRLQNNEYTLTLKDLDNVQDNLIIMHPLPRVNEIDISVDDHKSAKYFNQVKNGLYIQMTLLLNSLS